MAHVSTVVLAKFVVAANGQVVAAADEMERNVSTRPQQSV